jgi:hypothetical protein
LTITAISSRNRFLLHCQQEGITDTNNSTDASISASSAAEMTSFDREMRQSMGHRPDKLAETLFAVGTVQGSNVFKLVKDLDDLTVGLELALAQMKEAAKAAEEERLKKKSAKEEKLRGKAQDDHA